MAIIFEGANGDIQTFGPQALTPTDQAGVFSTDTLVAAFTEAGHSGESIRGTVHNHSAGINGDTATSAYPSGTDWGSTSFTSIGADTNNMSMYIIDNLGSSREFSYANEQYYYSLTSAQMAAGEGLPDGMEAGNDCSE